MLFEDLLILIFGVGVFIFAVIPIYKFASSYFTKRDNLKEARRQLEIAQAEVEVAKIRKQIEHIYDDMYTETLEDETINTTKKESR
jgi:hypothetical protein